MKQKKIIALIISIIVVLGIVWYVSSNNLSNNDNNIYAQNNTNGQGEKDMVQTEDGLILIEGGNFQMGSPENEVQRNEDETRHMVTVSDFYIGKYEITQKEYQKIIGENPSNFEGEDLPVENVTWYDAISYCNELSQKQGLEPVYTIDGENITWDKQKNGYRLPTEAEWEYAARAGTTTVFNTETSIGANEANFYGHYPYLIEENYFSQSNLETKPRRI